MSTLKSRKVAKNQDNEEKNVNPDNTTENAFKLT